jgi:hypothetical protein
LSIKTSPQIRKSEAAGPVNLLSDTEINPASVRSQPAFTGQAANRDSGTSTFIKTAAAFLISPHILRKVGMMVAAGSAGSGAAAAAAAALISSLDKDQTLNVTKGDSVTTPAAHIQKLETTVVHESAISKNAEDPNVRLVMDLLTNASSLSGTLKTEADPDSDVPYYLPWVGAASGVVMTLGVAVTIRTFCYCCKLEVNKSKFFEHLSISMRFDTSFLFSAKMRTNETVKEGRLHVSQTKRASDFPMVNRSKAYNAAKIDSEDE